MNVAAFDLHLILAFVVGAAWVTSVTVVAERYGSSWGGFMGGLPSTTAFGFFFIGLNQSADVAVQATTIVPFVFGFTCLFLGTYAYFSRRGFAIGISLSLLIWFVMATLATLSGVQDFVLLLLAGGLVFVAALVIETSVRLESFPGEKVHYTLGQLVWRATFCGVVVSSAVLLSQVAGPTLGGVFSVFPVVFTSTLSVTYQSKGLEFSRSVTRPLMISAMLSVVPYTVAVRLLYPNVGIWWGTLAAYIAVVPFALFAHYLARHGEHPAAHWHKSVPQS